MSIEEYGSRDGRSLSAMDKEFLPHDAELVLWAKWGKEHLTGLPSENWLYKWIKFGIDGARQSGPPPQMPDHVARTDRLICVVRRAEGELVARVLRQFYLDWAPAEVMARKCQMSANQFRTKLRRGRRAFRAASLAIDEISLLIATPQYKPTTVGNSTSAPDKAHSSRIQGALQSAHLRAG